MEIDGSGMNELETDGIDRVRLLSRRVAGECEGERDASEVVVWKKEIYYAKPRGRPSREGADRTFVRSVILRV